MHRIARSLAVAATLVLVLGATAAAKTSSPAHPANKRSTQTSTHHIKETSNRLYLTILTGKMLNKSGWPAFVPADMVVPAHTWVTVVVRNFDDGTAPLLKGMTMYTRVQGTWGHEEEINEHVATALANARISHTFTITKLHLNVPIPAGATVEFTFKTPSPGVYTWNCMAPCGTGPSSMGGAMVTDGYMTGRLVVG